jgi:hypothetical protein
MKAFATQIDSTVTAIDFSHCNVYSHSYTTNYVENRLVHICYDHMLYIKRLEDAIGAWLLLVRT